MPISETTLSRPQLSAVASSSPQPRIGWHIFPLALTMAVLLWLCYFPVACGWLVWVALVPLLALLRSSARPRWIYCSAWFGSLAFYLAAMQWMRVADPRMYATWIGLSFYCSFYFLLTVYLIRFLDRRTSLPLVLTVPIAWTAVEFLRATLLGGFSWYMLGYSQHTFLPLIQIADLTGAYGVSFLIAAVNAWLFEILWRFSVFGSRFSVPQPGDPETGNRKLKTKLGLLVQGLAVLAALIGTVLYGFWRLGQDRQTPGPRLALLQGNLDQRLRNDSVISEDAVQGMARHFHELAHLAAIYRPDLIVWPETSWPYEWLQEEEGPSPHCRAMAEDMVEKWHTNLLVGMNASTIVAGQPRRYNSAVLIDRQGQAAGRYDKIHRVPFGEYVPFRDWLPWMNYFAPYDFDYSIWPGEQFTRFPLVEAATGRRFSFGTLICYEDTDAAVARPYGGGDSTPPADFLLNISNDGWFDGTSEHDEHLAICRFRAIECRRSVARSVNMGISAIIDSNGRVLQPHELPRPDPHMDPDFHVWTVPMQRGAPTELPVSQWHAYKKVAGVLLATVPIDDRVSLYSRWGDWLPWTCWIFFGGVLLFAWIGRTWNKATS
jgi:apolipoprotein N-acyltransferase